MTDKKFFLPLLLSLLLMPSSVGAEYRAHSDTGTEIFDFIENQHREERANRLTDEQKKLLEDVEIAKETLPHPDLETEQVPAIFEGDDLVYHTETGEFIAAGHVDILHLAAAAQPGIVQRRLAEARLDRVLTDIPQYIQKIRIVLHLLASVSVLKEMPVKLVFPVVVMNIGNPYSFEGHSQRFFSFPQKKMNMIPHQAIREQLKHGFPLNTQHDLKKTPVVLII